MANHIIKDPKVFSEALRKLEISDPAHADTFNPLLESLVNNDAYLGQKVSEKETPQGAQAKADIAEANANTYTDTKVSGLAGAGRTTETVKGNADDIAAVDSAVAAHLAEKATQTQLGHVKAGNGVNINANGVLSVELETINEFVVKSGETVTAEEVVAFFKDGLKTASPLKSMTATNFAQVSSSNTFVDACVIDSNRLAVAYKSNDSNSVMVSIITTAGNSISASTPVAIYSPATFVSCVSIQAPSTTRLVLLVSNNSASLNAVIAFLLDLNGTTVSNITSPSTGYAVLGTGPVATFVTSCVYSATELIVAYKTDSTHPNIVYISFSGTTFGKGSAIQVGSISMTSGLLFKVADYYVIFVSHEPSAKTLTVTPIQVSGSSLLQSTTLVALNDINPSVPVSTSKVSDTEYLVTSVNYNYPYEIKSAVVTIASGKAELKTIHTFALRGTSYIRSVSISDRKVLILCQFYSQNKLAGIVVSVDEEYNIILHTWGYITNDAWMNYPCLVSTENQKAVALYQDTSNKCIISFVIQSDGTCNILGIAKESKQSGESCKVSIGPIVTGLSGLTVGSTYYISNTGALTTKIGNCQMGVAISATELRQIIKEV